MSLRYTILHKRSASAKPLAAGRADCLNSQHPDCGAPSVGRVRAATSAVQDLLFIVSTSPHLVASLFSTAYLAWSVLPQIQYQHPLLSPTHTDVLIFLYFYIATHGLRPTLHGGFPDLVFYPFTHDDCTQYTSASPDIDRLEILLFVFRITSRDDNSSVCFSP